MFGVSKKLGFVVLAILIIPALKGCSSPPEPTKDFDARFVEGTGGDNPHSLNITYRGKTELTECTLNISISYEDGEKGELKGNFAKWKPGEEKKFKVPKSNYQFSEMKGTAKRGEEAWPFVYKHSK